MNVEVAYYVHIDYDISYSLFTVYPCICMYIRIFFIIYLFFQHANEDVEKMILGNKCDMEEKRVVSKERGEAVSIHLQFSLHFNADI